MRIIAVDYGDVRTGVAVSDPSGRIAGDAFTLRGLTDKALVQELCRVAAERGAGQFVLGLPRNMDGTEGPRAVLTRAFGQKLERASGLPVTFADERLTTVDAHRRLHDAGRHGAKNRDRVDAVAAVLILEGYLGRF